MPGTPSIARLTSLPSANPPIKVILVIVAVIQHLDLIMPIIQITDMLRYKPIMALKICTRLIASTLKLNSKGRIFCGYKP